MPNIGIHALRLQPGADLKKSLQAFAEEKKIIAGWIAACVGSLISYCLRFANQSETACGEGFFEIISLSGTFSVNGPHLHMGICDKAGKTTGGHVMEGCIYIRRLRLLFKVPTHSGLREKRILPPARTNYGSWKQITRMTSSQYSYA